MKRPHLRLLAAIAAPVLTALTLAGCRGAGSTADIPAVRDFELPKYLGRWYEIARLTHRFERGMSGCRADYTLRPDGRVKVLNAGLLDGRWHSVEGVAELRGDPAVGELDVSFFRPFYGGYRIIRLDPAYRVAVVTSDTRDYLWILARSPELTPEVRKSLLDWLKTQNFAVDELEFPAPAPDRD